MQNLFIKSGNRYRSATSSEVCEAASGYLFETAKQSRVAIGSPKTACDFIRNQAGLDFEQFGVIYLDKRNRIIEVEVPFNGTIDGASVHPREIVKRVLGIGAAAVILFHNHPSGVAEPSQADEMITQRLKDALALIDVRLLDHLIVAGMGVTSLAERGLV